MIVPPVSKPGGSPATGGNAPVASAAKPVSSSQLAGAAVAPPQPPAAFGGHRGGGKKRLDGLPAGSPEAIAADKAKDRERKALAAAKAKLATLPPALPGGTAAGLGAAVAVVDGATLMSGAVAGMAVPVVPLVSVSHVPWTTKTLEKPARLFTKIIDRVRCFALAKKIRALKLSPKDEAEILADIKWQETAANDFSAALADCAQVELNKRRVPGAENSHFINLAMCGGELATAHFATLDRLEKMMAEKLAAEAAEKRPRNDTEPVAMALFPKN